ncbi:MAG: hypothetical protein ACYC4S_09695 [Rhodoferax sp.]
MNLPADLSPETATWMRMQMTMAAARAVEPLKAEINQVDDWANGVFVVLRDVLPYLMKTFPELARNVAPHWSAAALDFDRIDVHGHPAKPDEPLEFLEARKMLYRTFALLGVWEAAQQQKPLKSVPRSRRA